MYSNQDPQLGYPAQTGWTPPPAPKRPMKWLPAAVASALLVAGGAYAGHYVFGGRAGTCAVAAGVEYTDITPKSPGEPTLRVPAADGWSQYPLSSLPPAAQNLKVQGFLVNTRLQAAGFTPNVVVTLDKVAGDDSAGDEEILEREMNMVKTAATVSSERSYEVCGFPAVTAESANIAGAQTGAWLAVVFTDPQKQRWVATATVQTRDPSAPGYIAERDALVSGFGIEFGTAA